MNIQTMKVKDAFELALSIKTITPETRRHYQLTGERLSQQFETLPLKAVDIERFLSSLVDLADITRVNTYQDMKSIYNTLERKFDMFDEVRNPFYKVDRPKTSRKIRRTFTPDEIKAIINSCLDDYERMLILVLIDGAMRIGELSALTISGVRGSSLYIKSTSTARAGKTGERVYKVNPELAQMIIYICKPNCIYPFSRSGKDLTTYELRRSNSKANQSVVRRIMVRAGLTGSKLGAHTLRHTSATITAKETGSLIAVQRLLQHDRAATSEIYIHMADDESEQEFSPLDAIMTKTTDYSPDYKPVQTEFVEISKDGTEIIETLPAIQTNMINDTSKSDYWNLIEQDLKEITDDTRIRPKLTAQDLRIIQHCILTCARANALGTYSGQAIALLKRIMRKV